MLKKQQYHHNFLESIAMNRSFIQSEQNSLDFIQVISEESSKSNMIPQSRLDVTIQEITFAVATPFSNQKKQKLNIVENKQINEYQERRKLRQELSQNQWISLNQFCEKKKREITCLRRKEQLRNEKKRQLKKEEQEYSRKEKVQVKNLKQSKLNITELKQNYNQMKSTSTKTNIQFIKRQKYWKQVANCYTDQTIQHKRQQKEEFNYKKVTLTETQELILGLAVYLRLLQTSFIQSCLPISQNQAKQYFLDNAYRIMLLSRDLLTNYKKKLVLIYNQPNQNLIQLFQLCMQKNGLYLEDIIEQCDQMPEFPSLHKPISFSTLFKYQVRQCDKQ